MQLTSTAFGDQEPIPPRHSCDGANVAPPLAWRDVPGDAVSLAIVCLDPDAPGGTFTHWTIWNLDPTLPGLGEGEVPSSAEQGRNSFGDLGYGGPCPPPGHGVHHYQFQLVALRAPLGVRPGSDPEAVQAACAQHELARTECVGSYERR